MPQISAFGRVFFSQHLKTCEYCPPGREGSLRVKHQQGWPSELEFQRHHRSDEHSVEDDGDDEDDDEDKGEDHHRDEDHQHHHHETHNNPVHHTVVPGVEVAVSRRFRLFTCSST